MLWLSGQFKAVTTSELRQQDLVAYWKRGVCTKHAAAAAAADDDALLW